MSLNVSTTPIVVKKPLGRANTNVKIESEIIVPDIKPDITRIVLSFFDVENIACTCKQGAVEVSGDIVQQIVYASNADEQMLRSLKQRTPFNVEIEAPNASPDSKCKCNATIISNETRPINPRKVHTIVEMAIGTNSNQVVEIPAISGINAPDDVQQLSTPFSYKKFAGEAQTTINVIDSVVIPENKSPIWEVFYHKITLPKLNMQRSGAFADLKGSALLEVVYLPENEEEGMQSMEFQIPVSGTVKLDDLQQADECELTINVSNRQLEGVEDETGQIRRLAVEMAVDALVEGYQNVTQDIVLDAFMPDTAVEFEHEDVVQEVQREVSTGSFLIDQVILVQDPLPPIKQIVLGKAKVKRANIVNMENEWRIAGVVELKIAYMSDENEMRGIASDIPFYKVIDQAPEEFYDATPTLYVKNLSISMMSPEEIKALIDMEYEVAFIKREETPVKVACVQGEPDVRVGKDDIVVYIADANDTNWDIAKKYLVKTSNILQMNGDELGAELEDGQRLFIMNG